MATGLTGEQEAAQALPAAAPPASRPQPTPARLRGARGRPAILACEDDGSRLTVAVVAASGDGAAQVLHSASRPRGGSLADDLRDALAALPPQVPKDAIFVSARATARCLELPPTHALTHLEVLSLVQRELEQFLLTADTPEGTADLACGWSARPAGRGAVPLFAAGLETGERDQIVATFASASLRLRGVYPLLACAAACLDPDDAQSTDVLEVGLEHVSCIRVAGGAVTRFALARIDDGDVARACFSLCEQNHASIVVAGPAPDTISAVFDTRSVSRAGEQGGLSASLLGAAHHALGLRGSRFAPAIPARAPRPPLFARLWLRIAAAALLLVALAVAGDRRLAEHIGEERRAAAALREQVDERLDELAEHARLQERAARLRVDVADLERQVSVHLACERRRAHVRGLLDALAGVATPRVAIDSIEEREAGEVTLSGFALSEVAVQAYVHDLRRVTERLGVAPVDVNVRRSIGRLGIAGFAFGLRLVVAEDGR